MSIYIFTEEQMRKTLTEAIIMEREFRHQYGYSSDESVIKAEQEMIEGLDAEKDLAREHKVKPNQIVIDPDFEVFIENNIWKAQNA